MISPCFVDDGSDLFTVELMHGGYFLGHGGNRSYLDGHKVFFDFCDANEASMGMLDELVEVLGYESGGRISIYLLLPGMQINEHGLKLVANNFDRNCIRTLVREGHKFLMFYLDHQESMHEGNCEIDDVVKVHGCPMCGFGH